MSELTEAFDYVEASNPKIIRPTIADQDQWSMEKNREPWVRPLKRLMCKIGPANWPAWEALIEEYGQELVVRASKETPVNNRWPDEVARRLDRKASNLLELKKQLNACGLASNDESIESWAALLTKKGNCSTLPHCGECLAWLVATAEKKGIRMVFPSDAAPLVHLWRPQ